MPRLQAPPASTDRSIRAFVYRPMDAVFQLQPDARQGLECAVMDVLSAGRANRITGEAGAGTPPRLSVRQKQKLVALLVKGPLRAGYRTGLWTLPRMGFSSFPACAGPGRRAARRPACAIGIAVTASPRAAGWRSPKGGRLGLYLRWHRRSRHPLGSRSDSPASHRARVRCGALAAPRALLLFRSCIHASGLPRPR
jgi:hypothetical protein